jgi:ATP-dependent exoDNAse (exonuclease V) alpha subunit
MLNEQQQQAQDLILNHVKGGDDKRYIYVTGAAGTGKTYLVGDTMSKLKDYSICISAPTQRAVAELTKKSPPTDGKRTIHSLLGLRDDQDKFELSFIQKAQVAIGQYDIIFIDESSMINYDLFEALLAYKGDTKLIFIGDVEQLAPVEGHQPDIFVDGADALGVRLTKIERQADGSPIIDLATHFLTTLDFPDEFVYNVNDSGGTYIASSKVDEDREFIKDKITELFSSREYAENASYARIVCATNNMVAEMNKFVRQAIYGMEAKENKILFGEKMIANGGRHLVDDKVVLVNNDEFIVKNYQIEMETIDNLPFFYYLCEIDYTTKSGSSEIRVLHEQSQDNYNRVVDKFNKAKEAYQPKSQAYMELARQWKSFLAYFASVDYAYSLSCHKCQGSTVENVVVLANNLLSVRPWDYDTKRRWMYTATTRASKNVFIIV